MAGVESSSAEVIVFTPKASKAPPATTVGVLGWLRENLFYSWFSAVLTFAAAYLIFITLAALYQWGIADAVWEAESRRQCLDTSPDGACWAGIVTWFNAIMYGRFPHDEQWRVNLGFIILFLWMAPMWFPRLKGKISIGIMLVALYPFLAGYLFAGGERGWFMQFMVILAVTAFIRHLAEHLSLPGNRANAGRMDHRLDGLRRQARAPAQIPDPRLHCDRFRHRLFFSARLVRCRR